MEGPSADYWEATGSPMLHSHNAFLDSLVELGVVGLMLLIIALAFTFRNAWRLFRSSPVVPDSWPFFFLLFLLSYSFTETGMLRTNHILWIIFTEIAFTLGCSMRNIVLERRTGLPRTWTEGQASSIDRGPVPGLQL